MRFSVRSSSTSSSLFVAQSAVSDAARKVSAPQRLTPGEIVKCLDDLRAGFQNAEVIYRRGNRIVIRWYPLTSHKSLIIKMWSRPDLKGRLRSLLHISSCDHEWRTLVRLSGVNMAVPHPLGFCRLTPAIAGYTEALFTEDIGECESATSHLKKLIQTRQEQEVFQFENIMIEMTEQILAAGMVDVDHGLVNIVVQSSGRPIRLDFELARLVIWPRLFSKWYGEMLGQLILLHAFAVQPDTHRTTKFAERLSERLSPPRRALTRAGIYIRKYLKVQFENTGIDTRLTLPWD